jgi:DNA uptake protein ComE-like DNA-binding protein
MITSVAIDAELPENRAVRAQSRILLLAAAVFCAPLTGVEQNAQASTPASKAHLIPPPEMRTDINHASAEELMQIPGMTRTWAARIVRFRPYRTKQDLVDQGVLTSEVYDRIKDYVIAHREKQ